MANVPGSDDRTRHAERSPETTTSPSDVEDAFYAVLAAPDRRFVLDYLSRQAVPVPVGQVGAALAAHRDHTIVDRTSPEARARARVDLVHVHLPMLGEAGYVDWERDRETVTLTTLVDELTVQTPIGGSLFAARVDRAGRDPVAGP